MIITRDIINPNIKFTDVDADWQEHHYGHSDVCDLINAYKNLLQHKYHCRPGQKAIIGTVPGIEQTAMTFACAELGLIIVINDIVPGATMTMAQHINSMAANLLPVDFFLIETPERLESREKFQACRDISTHTVFLKNVELDYAHNDAVVATENTPVIVCPSATKVVYHQHKFIYHLVLRNSQQLFGTVGSYRNLQHGSSLATYFLPSLVSSRTTQCLNFQCRDVEENFWEKLSSYRLNHLMIPYSYLVPFFFNAAKPNQDLVVYTLSFISPTWAQYIQQGKAKNIVSSFGSTETGGPIFVNQLMPLDQFDPRNLVKVDDFYNITFDSQGFMTVDLPHSNNVSVRTNDKFEFQSNGKYYFHGRSDLVRINGWPIDVNRYNDIANGVAAPCELIADVVENKIYLAAWQDITKQQIDAINYMIDVASAANHRIDKFAKLDQTQFLSGTELDLDLVCQYFRINH
jgi:acyl-coenzyme A synthetase/AMP-(fatty) acid ligase